MSGKAKRLGLIDGFESDSRPEGRVNNSKSLS